MYLLQISGCRTNQITQGCASWPLVFSTDFTGNSNASKVIKGATMVTQQWFIDAINTPEPVDVFPLIGHNIARPSTGGSTFGLVYNAIRKIHPNTPIQIFGGHSHIRDVAVVDEASTALEAGRYCETVGWFSMSGFDKSNSGYSGVKNPRGVPNPTRKAVANSTTPGFTAAATSTGTATPSSTMPSAHSLTPISTIIAALRVTAEITAAREKLGLGKVYGCVPNFYCMTCVPFTDPLNIYTALSDAMGTAVANPARAGKARFVYCNTGGIRFDMHKGPFTYDDNFIVSPFRDVFLYVPDVPYALASTVLAKLNAGGANKRDQLGSMPMPRDTCVNPILGPVERREESEHSGVTRRQTVTLNPGYTTKDDFGTDGTYSAPAPRSSSNKGANTD